ncbi:hypothetical protein MTO96_047290, partial [Rhipicephalus appendiculatus]
EIIDQLCGKDSFAELDIQIPTLLTVGHLDEDIMSTLYHHEKIAKAIRRLQTALKVRASVCPTVVETNQLNQAETSDVSRNSV